MKKKFIRFIFKTSRRNVPLYIALSKDLTPRLQATSQISLDFKKKISKIN
jgi:hypothetical protein